MVPSIKEEWRGTTQLTREVWRCGNCGSQVAQRLGYSAGGESAPSPRIYPCPQCGFPTLFWHGRHPNSKPGEQVEHLPSDVQRVYEQARDCCRVGAFDGAALLARSLLMYIAVSRGAKPGLSFVDYVQFLDTGHFVPPDSHEWVDHVRKQGNRSAHEIGAVVEGEAAELIEFVELLLRYLYEFPGRMRARKAATKAVPDIVRSPPSVGTGS